MILPRLQRVTASTAYKEVLCDPLIPDSATNRSIDFILQQWRRSRGNGGQPPPPKKRKKWSGEGPKLDTTLKILLVMCIRDRAYDIVM